MSVGLTVHSQALYDAIDDYDGLLICSAGNNNKNNDASEHYPTNYSFSNMIVVGASTSNDTKQEKSNYGKTSVDLFAPGEGILSCFPTTLCDNYCDEENHPYENINIRGYHYNSGTSFAAPYVAGVAALILSKYPTLTADKIKERIINSVDPVSALSNYCVSGGRLNAYKAVHNHVFSQGCESLGPLKHSGTCSCGVFGEAHHTYVSSAAGFTCTLCGQTTRVLPYSYEDDHLTA